MEVYVTSIGQIRLHKVIEEKDADAIMEFFRSHGFTVGNVTFADASILDYAPSDITINMDKELQQAFLDELKLFVEKLGYDILPETHIEVLGDYYGDWFYIDGKFVYKDEIESAIYRADDHQLICELEHRGYEVMKHTTVRRCDICEENS